MIWVRVREREKKTVLNFISDVILNVDICVAEIGRMIKSVTI